MIIPAYNQDRFLGEAIDSVLAQTRPPDEIIVVDDGSSDETAEIARSYGGALRLVQQKNRGLAGARNRGIHEAQGRWIGFLDADDRWHPPFLKRVLEACRREPRADVLFTGLCLIADDGRRLPGRIPDRPGLLDRPFWAQLRGSIALPSATVARKSLLVQVGGYDERLRRVEDWDLCLTLARQGAAFVGVPGDLVDYRLHGASLTTHRAEMRASLAFVVEKHVGQAPKACAEASPVQRRGWAAFHRNLAITSLSRYADWSEPWEELAAALAIDPTLLEDESLFYELALGTQPLGLRGSAEGLDLEGSAREIARALDTTRGLTFLDVPTRKDVAYELWLAFARIAYGVDEATLARRGLWEAFRARPRRVLFRGWLALAMRCTLLWPFVRARRNGKRTARASAEQGA